MENIFNIDINNGKISLNEKYADPTMMLMSHLVSLFGKEKHVDLFFWSFRADGRIAHTIKIATANGLKQYRLNILEMNEVTFNSNAFFSDKGEITLLDSADVTWLVHYIEYHLPHIHLRKGIFNHFFQNGN